MIARTRRLMLPRDEPAPGLRSAPLSSSSLPRGREAVGLGSRAFGQPRAGARRVRRALAGLKTLEPMPAPVRPELPVPRLSLTQVGAALTARPALRVLLLALAGAIVAHVAFASWSLAQRPVKKKARSMTMAVMAEPERLPADEALPPPPPPSPPPSGAQAGASASPTVAPGPIIPGLSPVAGPGSGQGLSIGGGGPAPSAASTAEAQGAGPRVEAPRPLTRAAPAFPARARERGVEGLVSLHILVGADGSVREVRVLHAEPPGVFEEAAIAAARRWRFAPGTHDGRAQDAWVRQTVRFTLQ